MAMFEYMAVEQNFVAWCEV